MGCYAYGTKRRPSQITEVETKMTSITFDEALEEIASKSDEYRAVIEDAIRAANAEEIPDADDIICTEASPSSRGVYKKPEKECCATCRGRMDLVKFDYSDDGCGRTDLDGFVCMAFQNEGKAIWMVDVDEEKDHCECYSLRIRREK